MLKENDSYENIVTELCKYLLSLHQRKYDLVICIERRGVALYNDVLACIPELKQIPRFSSKALDWLDVSGKNILLFDDTINKGNTCKNIKRTLLNSGASNVDIAVYAKLKDCNLSTLNPIHVVDKKRFEKIRDKITQHMSNRLISTDTDHVYAVGHVNGEIQIEQLLKDLREMGGVYVNAHDYDVIKIALDGEDLISWKSLKLPSYVHDMPSWKIRINFFVRKGMICIFPIGFPEINNKINDNFHSFKFCLCKRYARNWRQLNKDRELLTNYCIVLNSQLSLLIAFLKKWNKSLKNSKLNFFLDYVSYQDSRDVFNDSLLENEISNLVFSSMEKFE